MIAEGSVLVGGATAEKASRLVAADEPIEISGPRGRFVGRGGEKLEAALERFGIDVHGRTVLDAGASTGGFTDCLLQRGAASVVAVDVGRGQLHERLRGDTRVTVLERTHIRDVSPDRFGVEGFGMVVADLSFISLQSVARVLAGLVRPGGELVVLVKPQFEAGRQEASRGRGVVRDPEVWTRVLREVITAFRQAGAAMMGVMPSPIRGADGNVEFLVRFRRQGEPDIPGLPPEREDAGRDDAEVGKAVAEVTATGDLP